ncbi:recombinase family protein [Agrobacterium rosae]
MPKPKAYSYLRFSTPEQMRGDSFRRQSDMARQWAVRNGVELDDKLTFQDLGVSAYTGANAETGMLREFLEAVRVGMIEKGSFLLIESLDRLSRNTARKAMRLLEDICESGIAVVTLSDGKVYTDSNLSTDPISFMMAFMVMIRANEESATKARRLGQAWKEKRRKATEEAVPMTSITPAWLRLDKVQGGFVVLEDRAEVVRRVFRMTLDGVGQHQIADTFNTEGIPSFGRSEYWHRSYIKKLLENPAVIGMFTPHTIDRSGVKKRRIPQSPVERYFPSIIAESVFQDVQAQRVGADRFARQGGKYPIASVFAGLAQCPLCGSTMTRVSKGPKGGAPKLVCVRAKTGAGCRYQGVPIEQAERVLIENAAWLIEMAPSGDDRVDDAIDRARINLEVLEDQIGNVLEAIAGGASGSAINERLGQLEAEKETVEKQLNGLEREQNAQTGKLVERRLAELYDALTMRPFEDWEPADRQLANASLRQVVSAVVINYRFGYLEFLWKHGGFSQLVLGFPMEDAPTQ